MVQAHQTRGPHSLRGARTFSARIHGDQGVDTGCQAGEEIPEEEQGVLRGEGAGRVELEAGRGSPGLCTPQPLTWSTLSRRGISETRRQHSGAPRLVVGATCSALMVSWGQRAGFLGSMGVLPHPKVPW